MTLFEQDKRRLLVETPLGKDKLLLEAFHGTEGLSIPFAFELDLVSQDHGIKAADLVGKAIGFQARSQGGKARYFHGHVARFVAGSMVQRDLRRYRALVVPWVWFLGKRRNCRIFQDMTVLDIAQQLFGELKFGDYETGNVRGEMPRMEYCVQYRETDLEFLSRLFEEFGVFYTFRHEQDRHVLVLADAKLAYTDCEEHDVPYSAGSPAANHITAWEHGWQFVSGAWAHADYNFETPLTQLRSKATTVVDLPGTGPYEVFEYPGRFGAGKQGEDLVRRRMEEEEAGWDVVEGQSTCRSFFPGGKFKLTSHECGAEEGQEYVLIAVEHSARDASLLGEGAASVEISNRFRCIPADVVFRPPRSASRPVIPGAQTAIVVGPEGEEIYTDRYGRIKVQFHWDREGKGDEKSSCWIRVAQVWAGKNWGATFHPRIGQEVVVEFLDGDPDRPLVTGSVYNADQTPPYDLPANQTQTVIKSRSTRSGDPETFNELRFEDKKDAELLYLHAQKDQQGVVENDQSLSVGHDRSTSIGNDESDTVGHDRKVKIGNDLEERVEKNARISVGVDRTEDVGKNQRLSVGGDSSTTIDGGLSLSVSKDVVVQVKGGRDESITKNWSVEAKKILLQAGDEIVIQTGSASVKLKKNGDITIKGKTIKIDGSGDVILKGAKITEN